MEGCSHANPETKLQSGTNFRKHLNLHIANKQLRLDDPFLIAKTCKIRSFICLNCTLIKHNRNVRGFMMCSTCNENRMMDLTTTPDTDGKFCIRRSDDSEWIITDSPVQVNAPLEGKYASSTSSQASENSSNHLSDAIHQPELNTPGSINPYRY